MRLGIVGCGAAAQKLHLPALARAIPFRITALVDTVLAHADAAAHRYAELLAQPVPVLVTDRLEEAIDEIDAAIVATASAYHADVAAVLLRAGKHVLVEKPMALGLSGCDRMRAAAEAGRAMVVPGHVRRLFPLVQWIKSIMDSGRLGAVHRVRWAEGSPYDWGVAGAAMFGPPASGGGVLADLGPHVFDTLRYWFAGQGPGTVTRVATNSVAGADSEAAVRLTFAGTVVEVELSRLRTLADRCVIEAERGSLTVEIDIDDAGYVERDADGAVTAMGPVPVPPGAVASWDLLFCTQLAEFHRAVTGAATPLATFQDGVEVARLLEECRTARQERLPRPWADPRPPARRPPAGRIAVTGATGFIGAHVVERLVTTVDGPRVVAVTRDLRRLARLSHLDPARVQHVRADLRDRGALKDAFRDCDVVVHAAYGSTGGPAEQWSVTVEGTAAVLDAAADAGVRRVVHLSTADVYDTVDGAVLDERCARIAARPGVLSYRQQKLVAEEVVMARAGGSPEVVCLQPTIVYGPWSPAWTVSVLEEDLRTANDILPTGPAGGVCNALHVHDLADAVLVVAAAPGAAGLRLLVSGPEPVGWGEYYDGYRRMAGVPPPDYYDADKVPGTDRALYASRVVVSTDLLAGLGFRPRITVADGMAQVGAWARWAGIL